MEFPNNDLHIYISIFNFEFFELEFIIFTSKLFSITSYPYRNFVNFFFQGIIFFFSNYMAGQY